MESLTAHINEWLNLIIRWIHVIVGVAWIGASFYFNWLENRLHRDGPQKDGIAGYLWAVHGGGFYHLEKYKLAPDELPETLHWFKWEAYTTWLSGFALLIVVYYFNATAFLIDRSVADISVPVAIGIGIASLVVSWLFYDQLCRTALSDKPRLLGAIIFLYLSVLAFVLTEVLSSRAAFIHVGAAIGTIMVANVLMVIIPSQRVLVDAVKNGQVPDAVHGKNGLLRSRHNNYLTLPVLFIMVSSHYPMIFGSSWNWLLLIALSAISVLVRHYFNVRHLAIASGWMLPVAAVLIVALVWLTRPAANPLSTSTVSDVRVQSIVDAHCVSCHAVVPTQPGFTAPPKGVVLESLAELRQHAEGVHAVSVATKTMPLGNMSGMTDEERVELGQWLRQ